MPRNTATSSRSDSPAAIGCPPNFEKHSRHLHISSYIEYASVDLPDPFTPSSPSVRTNTGLW